MSKTVPTLELDTMVDERLVKKKAGKSPKYKLVLKGDGGNSLTIVSDNKAVYEGFPEDTMFTVKIAKTHAVLSETFEHVVETEAEKE